MTETNDEKKALEFQKSIHLLKADTFYKELKDKLKMAKDDT